MSYYGKRQPYAPPGGSSQQVFGVGRYSPPKNGQLPEPRAKAGVDAAAALEILRCDPDSLLNTGGGVGVAAQPSRGAQASEPRPDRQRQSAAKLARERYAEALKAAAAKANSFDLLDLNSPSGGSSSSAAVAMPAVDSTVVAAPMMFATTSPASATVAPQGAAKDCPGHLDHAAVDGGDVDRVLSASALWPGDVVLARYGPTTNFYRARIVRVYSSRGASLADVEWLRPQAGAPPDNDFVCSAGLDDTLNRNGLQVGEDLRRFPGDSGRGGCLGGGSGGSDAAASRGPAAAADASASGRSSEQRQVQSNVVIPALAPPTAGRGPAVSAPGFDDLLGLDASTVEAAGPPPQASAVTALTGSSTDGLGGMAPVADNANGAWPPPQFGLSAAVPATLPVSAAHVASSGSQLLAVMPPSSGVACTGTEPSLLPGSAPMQMPVARPHTPGSTLGAEDAPQASHGGTSESERFGFVSDMISSAVDGRGDQNCQSGSASVQ